jgi:predicted ArsR family transcriptional regulator
MRKKRRCCRDAGRADPEGRLAGPGAWLRRAAAHRTDYRRRAARRAGRALSGTGALEHQGLLGSEWGTSDNNRRAKFYRLTAAGRRRLKTETDRWDRLAMAMSRALRAEGV